MSLADIVKSCSNELEEANAKAIKLEENLARGSVLKEEYQTYMQPHQKSKIDYRRQDFEETRSSNGPSTGQNCTSVLDEQISSIDDTTLSSKSPISAAPICRQFWKAGNYEEGLASKSTIQNSGSYLSIHPKFLHSNATSHKWAFGALAELLDNAIDEIQNGATFVVVDKTTNARDGRPALLIQDDGGGMDPEGMRRCLSFGFSDKKSKSSIGRYGNGFKTSSMRLGADAIVFSRHVKDRKLTQSIGLLSYTFLTRTGNNRIVVPMVDYELNPATGKLEMLNKYDEESFRSNLSILLQWSPYTTQEELLKQFDDIGYHGTKVVIYNLWCDDQGALELDFDSDPEDIRLKEAAKVPEKSATRLANEQHIANQLRYSLRVYLSILYLQLPQTFSILLRGRVVLYHNIASDLKYPEFIMYRPAGSSEGFLTSIGFLKEAPHVNIHGFNVYHKNRLILPFWHVVSYSDSRGRGVVGVLDANFIEPTHNKQDFEKTAVFQKLETRLKEMTWEYWDHHCRLIGYKQPQKKLRAPTAKVVPAYGTSNESRVQPVVLNMNSFLSPSARAAPLGPQLKRKEGYQLAETEFLKRRAGEAVNGIDTRIHQAVSSTINLLDDDKAAHSMQENKNLRALCMDYEKNEEELNIKVTQLRSKLEEMELEYARLLAELQLLEKPKEENIVTAR